MKTQTKEEIKVLKSNHRLELVMQQEARESFETDAKKPDQWHSTITPGLTVDIRRQVYELARPGMDTESGDVLAWLQRHYGFTFKKAVSFLMARPSDPKNTTQPAKVKKSAQVAKKKQDDFHYPDANAMDEDQTRAFDLAHSWIEKYFSMSSSEIQLLINKTPQRFKKVIDLRVEKCASCETPFNWQLEGTFAYAQEDIKEPDIYFACDDDNFSHRRRTFL